MKQDFNDIYHIVARLDRLTEGKITPIGVKHGLNPQQQSAKQMPALFKPKSISVLGAKKDPKHPAQGYFVGGESIETESEESNPMRRAVMHRIVNQHPEWITKYGAEALVQAIDDVTEGDTDWEEIGSSDVSAYVNYVQDALRDRMGGREEMDDRKPFAEDITEAQATEDVLSTVKKKLGDYLQDVATAIKKDPDLKDKIPQDIDQVKAVKTIHTDDGHEIKIHGNEDDGFRVSIRNREIKRPFKTLDEATMACEMYCSKRRNEMLNADYVEER